MLSHYLQHTPAAHSWLDTGCVRVHGTALLYQGQGVLLIGEAGCGKSYSAAAMIEEGATLIADDQVICHISNHETTMSAPPNIAGVLALRGLGLLKLACEASAPLDKVVLLSPEWGEAEVPADDIPMRATRCFKAYQALGKQLPEDWIPEVA